MPYTKPIGPFELHITPLPEGGRVMDIGFGFGENIIPFAQAGFTTVAVDNSRELLDALREKTQQLGIAMEIIDADATNIPVPSDSIDLVILTEVLEHIRPYERLVDEIHRVLKPGGYAIISVPTYSTEKIYTWLNKNYPANATHVNLFKKSYLKKMFVQHHFAVLAVHNRNFRPALFWIFNSAAHVEHNYVGKTQSGKKIEERFEKFFSWLDKIKLGYVVETYGRKLLAKSNYYYLKKV